MRASSPTQRRARETRARLHAAPDLARALARLVVGRGGPRDLAAIRDGLLRRPTRPRTSSLKDAPDESPGHRGCGAATRWVPIVARSRRTSGVQARRGFVRAGYDTVLNEARGRWRDDFFPARYRGLQSRYADDKYICIKMLKSGTRTRLGLSLFEATV